MFKFKIGDKVRCINKNANTSSELEIGKEYVVAEASLDYIKVVGSYVNWSDFQFELISNNTITNMKEKFIQMFLKEPQKSFRKAGVTNGDGFLTAEGTDMFLTWLLEKNGEVFKTDVVDGLLKEDK